MGRGNRAGEFDDPVGFHQGRGISPWVGVTEREGGQEAVLAKPGHVSG